MQPDVDVNYGTCSCVFENEVSSLAINVDGIVIYINPILNEIKWNYKTNSIWVTKTDTVWKYCVYNT